MNNIDHTDVNDCSQRLNDINFINHIRLSNYGVQESDSDFNIDNLMSNSEHNHTFCKIKL